MRAAHIVSVSGGKDSTATYLLALEWRERTGRDFRAVFADTGHEHPTTLDYVARLAERTGGPEVETVRADFAERLETRRRNLPDRWRADGVPEERIARALEVMRPTGNPFLDLCLLRGRFPSTRVRFCTEELKVIPIEREVLVPALALGDVVRWQGERREESAARSGLPLLQRVRWTEPARTMAIYRPLVAWTAAEVFDLHARHGLESNPLYRQGMGRVGCMPCVMCAKGELREIARRFPEEVARVAEWERLVAEASKLGLATFFAADKTPQGAALAQRLNDQAAAEVRAGQPEIPEFAEDGERRSPAFEVAVRKRVAELSKGETWPGIAEVAAWSRTSAGGRQFNFFEEFDAGATCSSHYGLCE